MNTHIETDALEEIIGAMPNNLPAVATPIPAPQRTDDRLPMTGIAQITKAIAAVMKEIDTVAKQGSNKFHGYKYARMEDILKEVTPLLGRHGIVIFQNEVQRSMFDNDAVIAIQYEFTVAHESGEVWPQRLVQTGASRCRDSKGGWDDKSLNKCHTAARKYFLLSLFQIPTGDEADADRGDNERGKTFTKAQGRERYSELQAVVANHVGPVAAFRRWMEDNAERIGMLPIDWQDHLRLQCQEKLIALREAIPDAPEPVVTDIASDHNPVDGEVIWDEATPSETDAPVSDPVQQAGIICKEPAFEKFVRNKYGPPHPDIADFVREFCGVKSRAELATDHRARVLWHGLIAEYRGWQREPAVIDPPQDSPSRSTPAADGPAPDIALASGAGRDHGPKRVPSAEDYTNRWMTQHIPKATDPVALLSMWDTQQAIRDQIKWPKSTDEAYLASKVREAVKFMGAKK